MKISAIVRADAGGLGTLSREFADFVGFHRTLSLAFREQRFDDMFFCTATNRAVARAHQITDADAEWLIDGADCLLGFETFYHPSVIHAARKRAVKTALLAMYEQTAMGGISNGMVDTVICPHELCVREAAITPAFRHARVVELPVPFDTVRVPFRRRDRARTFLHFAHFDRNGTHETIAAWQFVKSDARLIVNCLTDMPEQPRDGRIEIRRPGYVDYFDGWDEADVLLMPHRFAGLCLPFQHALAAGMPVITTRFWPFCDGGPLPRATSHIEPDLRERYESDGPGLLPASSQALAIDPAAMRRHVICRPILAFDTSPEAIATRVDELYDSDITAASQQGRAWAEQRSFDALRGRWLEELAA